MNKPPAPGYDIKTLKKEASYFDKEFNDLIEFIKTLQKQNVELISCMTAILNVNKHNAQLCRSKMLGFHQELKIVHDEILLLQKYDNHGDYHNDIKNNDNGAIDYHKIDEVLIRADSVTMMPMISDEVRSIAFKRLKNVIRQSLVLKNIDKVLSNFYCNRVLSMSFNGWKYYLDTKVLGLILRNKIKKKLTLQIMKQWKKLALSQKAANTKTMKRSLKIWITNTRWRIWSSDKVNTLRNKRYTDQFFQAWKSKCTFLDWGNLVVAARYQHAGFYFMRRIFNDFKNAVIDKNCEEDEKVWKIQKKMKRKCYRLWLSSCEKKWQRRGQLIRTFFANVSCLVSTKYRILYCQGEAIRFWSGFSKRRVLYKWAHVLRYKSRLNCKNQYRKANKLHLMNMFTCFKNGTMVTTKMRGNYDKAIHEYKTISKRRCFKILRLSCLLKRKRMWKCDVFLMKKFTNKWKRFMLSVNDFNKMNVKVTAYRKKRSIHAMAYVFNILYLLKEKRNRYNRYQKIIVWKMKKHLLSYHFKYMASKWSNRLFKKVTLKKCTLLTSKEISQNLNNNKQTMILEAESNLKQIYEVEGKIMELQKIISENEITMNDTDNMIRQEELSIENLSEEMEEKMQMLESVKQDHLNYKNVDHMMAVRKMYEDLKRDAVDHTSIKKEHGKRNYKLFITLNNSFFIT